MPRDMAWPMDVRPRHHRSWPMHAQGGGQCPAAARHAVRADPLERGQCIGRPRRRAGRADHRSIFRPAGSQGDAGVDPALRIRLSRFRAVAKAVRNCPIMPGGPAPRSGAAWAISLPIMRTSRGGRRGCAQWRARNLPNTAILAAACTARLRSRGMRSRPACSSDRRAMPVIGASSRNCSPQVPCRRATANTAVRQAGAGARKRGAGGLRLLRRRPQHDLRRDCCGRALGCRNRPAAQGRHQLRLVHSRTQTPDRAIRNASDRGTRRQVGHDGSLPATNARRLRKGASSEAIRFLLRHGCFAALAIRDKSLHSM